MYPLSEDRCRRYSAESARTSATMLVLAVCWYRFGQQPLRGAAEPGTAIRRQHDHLGNIGLPPARRSLPAPGLR